MNITIYTKSNCPNCVSAKQLLKSKGLDYFENDLSHSEIWEAFKQSNPDVRQLPQIVIDGQRVGGFAGLKATLEKMGL